MQTGDETLHHCGLPATSSMAPRSSSWIAFETEKQKQSCSWKRRSRWQACRSARWPNRALTFCTTQSSTHSAGARLGKCPLPLIAGMPADTGVRCIECMALCAYRCLYLFCVPLVSVSLIASISLPLYLPRTALQERTRRTTWVIPCLQANPNSVYAKTSSLSACPPASLVYADWYIQNKLASKWARNWLSDTQRTSKGQWPVLFAAQLISGGIYRSAA